MTRTPKSAVVSPRLGAQVGVGGHLAVGLVLAVLAAYLWASCACADAEGPLCDGFAPMWLSATTVLVLQERGAVEVDLKAGTTRTLATATRFHPEAVPIVSPTDPSSVAALTVVEKEGVSAGAVVSVLNLRTGEARSATDRPVNAQSAGLTWSRDGKALLFCADKSGVPLHEVTVTKSKVRYDPETGQAQRTETTATAQVPYSAIWQTAISGDEASQLTHEPACYDLAPQVSPVSDAVAFFRVYTDRTADGVMDDSGPMKACAVMVLTPGAQEPIAVSERTVDSFPRWSPDGRTIAFTRFEPRRDAIWVYDTESREARRLVSGDLYPVDPPRYISWSPDGADVCFLSSGDLYAAALEGGLPRRLTQRAGIEGVFSLSPDGAKVAFARDGKVHVRALAAPAAGAQEAAPAQGQ